MKLEIGDKATFKKIFTAEEVNNYALMSNDTNPVHLDEQYAQSTVFKKPIVHGLLVTSLFGGLLGTTLPGEGTIYLGQSAKFMKPIYVNEQVEAIIEIVDVRSDKPIITFKTIVLNSLGEIAIEGEAVVKYYG